MFSLHFICLYIKHYQAFCHNTIASYYCKCPPGYIWEEEHHWCEDLNECESDGNLHECEHTCNNEYGSYSCECRTGFQLSLNLHSCEDKDECRSGTHNCNTFPLRGDNVHGICANTLGSFLCICPHGYKWKCQHCDFSPLYSCFDVDECAVGTDHCQHNCTNRYASPLADGLLYECDCMQGFNISSNGRSCVDFDECSSLDNVCNSDISAECVNTYGSFHCKCETGYDFNYEEHQCKNINECEKNNGGCMGGCTDLPGRYICNCSAGYVLDRNRRNCLDKDECLESPCNHTCYNTPGSFYCTCSDGYQPLDYDLNQCGDVDECLDRNGGCMQNCSNTEGSYECTCLSNYILMADYVSCHLENECVGGVHDCQQICINRFDGYDCDCKKGYELQRDLKTCGELDECTLDNGGCEQSCVNTPGSFFCDCEAGYVRSQNKQNCLDIDECVRSQAGCTQLCYNSPGTYSCACEGGYQLGEDGKKCIGPNFIRLRSTLDLRWSPDYADTSSTQYQILKDWIDYNLATFICGTINSDQNSLECKANGPFQQGSVIFDFLAIAPSPLTALEQSTLSFNLKDAFKQRNDYFIINETSVAIMATPQFVYTAAGGSGGSERLWNIESQCDLFENTGYCMHDGTCKVDSNGNPVCECLEGYEGTRCEEHPNKDLTTIEVSLISLVSALVVAALILTIAVTWLCIRSTKRSEESYLREEMSHENTYPGYNNGSYPYYPYNWGPNNYLPRYPQYDSLMAK